MKGYLNIYSSKRVYFNEATVVDYITDKEIYECFGFDSRAILPQMRQLYSNCNFKFNRTPVYLGHKLEYELGKFHVQVHRARYLTLEIKII